MQEEFIYKYSDADRPKYAQDLQHFILLKESVQRALIVVLLKDDVKKTYPLQIK